MGLAGRCLTAARRGEESVEAEVGAMLEAEAMHSTIVLAEVIVKYLCRK